MAELVNSPLGNFKKKHLPDGFTRELSYDEMTPLKIEKKQVCIKIHFRQFQVF